MTALLAGKFPRKQCASLPVCPDDRAGRAADGKCPAYFRHKKTPAFAGAIVSSFRGGLFFSFQVIAREYEQTLGSFYWGAIAGFYQHFECLLD
jgi:hypothetical protein